jgi:hypothetical protein
MGHDSESINRAECALSGQSKDSRLTVYQRIMGWQTAAPGGAQSATGSIGGSLGRKAASSIGGAKVSRRRDTPGPLPGVRQPRRRAAAVRAGGVKLPPSPAPAAVAAGGDRSISILPMARASRPPPAPVAAAASGRGRSLTRAALAHRSRSRQVSREMSPEPAAAAGSLTHWLAEMGRSR